MRTERSIRFKIDAIDSPCTEAVNFSIPLGELYKAYFMVYGVSTKLSTKMA